METDSFALCLLYATCAMATLKGVQYACNNTVEQYLKRSHKDSTNR